MIYNIGKALYGDSAPDVCELHTGSRHPPLAERQRLFDRLRTHVQSPMPAPMERLPAAAPQAQRQLNKRLTELYQRRWEQGGVYEGAQSADVDAILSAATYDLYLGICHEQGAAPDHQRYGFDSHGSSRRFVLRVEHLRDKFALRQAGWVGRLSSINDVRWAADQYSLHMRRKWRDILSEQDGFTPPSPDSSTYFSEDMCPA